MHIYRQGRIWMMEWRERGRKFRRSTGTADKREATGIMQVFALARQRALPRKALHDALDSILGRDETAQDQPTGIPIASAMTIYDHTQAATGRTLGAQEQMARRGAWAALVAWLRQYAPETTTVEQVSRTVAAQFAADLARAGRLVPGPDGTPLRDSAGRIVRRRISDKSRRNMIGCLSSIWRVLGMASDRVTSPWGRLAPTVKDAVDRLAFTPEEERRVFEAARQSGGDWYALSVVARHTGLRYNDIATLRWAEVDMGAGVIRRIPHKTCAHQIAVTIPMADAVRTVLAALPRTGEWLFPARAAGWRGEIPFSAILRSAGVDTRDHTFHSWRHTFRTRLAEAGVSDDLAMRLGGWRSGETAARYDHAERIDELRRAIDSAARCITPRISAARKGGGLSSAP